LRAIASRSRLTGQGSSCGRAAMDDDLTATAEQTA